MDVRLEILTNSYRAMSLIPFRVILLFAVATSQIFGGISCCCLQRTLFADIHTGSRSTAYEHAAQSELSSVPQKQQTGKCPKCSARKSSPAIAVKTSSNQRRDHRAKVCEDGQCRCIKLVISANTPSDPPSPNHDSLAWVSLVLDVKPEREVLTRISSNFEVPVRFGGRSWQSIACVWKN